MDTSTLKCSFAEQVYDGYLQENYGIESCDFFGYNTLNGKLLDIFLKDYNKNCKCSPKEKICSTPLCSCSTNTCQDYDPYKVCCGKCK